MRMGEGYGAIVGIVNEVVVLGQNCLVLSRE